MANAAREEDDRTGTKVSGSLDGRPKTFRLVQALRGIAALMVVWHHTTLMQNERLSRAREVWIPGAGGVDLFFVISGFVMMLSSRSLSKTAHPMRTFLTRRVERVVPMYWLVTTVKLGMAALVPALAPGVTNGIWHIVASYLFLPSRNAIGAIHPVLLVGWTLNYEALFYLLVAFALGSRLPLLSFLSGGLLVLGLAGWLLEGMLPVVLSQIDPLLFEFGYGVLLAALLSAVQARRDMGIAVCWILMAGGFMTIQLQPQIGFVSRPFIWGLAAFAVVGAAVALEDAVGAWTPRWLLEIGDASYSNYLIHTLVLAVIGSLMIRYAGPWRTGWPATVGCVVVCVLAAEAAYRGIEMPIIRFFRERRTRNVLVN